MNTCQIDHQIFAGVDPFILCSCLVVVTHIKPVKESIKTLTEVWKRESPNNGLKFREKS